MPISAVQDTQNPHKHSSYIGSAILSGIIGHYAKFILPITPQEKDERFKNDLKQVSAEAKKTRSLAINEIKSSVDKTPAVDAFISLANRNKELSETEMHKHPENIANELMKFKSQINEKVAQTLAIGRKRVITTTKDLRPAHTFILIGGALGLITAFLKNVGRSFESTRTVHYEFD